MKNPAPKVELKINMFKSFQTAFLAVAFLWVIYFANFIIPVDIRNFGIHPKDTATLYHILTAPFIHANIAHITANSTTLFILLGVSLSINRKKTFLALFLITIISGFCVWVFGQSNTNHIGVSGIIFGMIGLLMFSGFFQGKILAVIISFATVFTYGGMLLFSLTTYIPGVSWTSHFFGFISGIISAWILRKD